MSTICSIFLRQGGTVEYLVAGTRRHSSDLPQGGLEVTCLLKFKTHGGKDCSRTNMLLISSISEFLEGSFVQSSCTLCTGVQATVTLSLLTVTSLLIAASLYSDSTNATIYSHSTSMQSCTIQSAVSSE